MTWKPEVGQYVWITWPDSSVPLGRVIGYVPEGKHARAGQPIIAQYRGDRWPMVSGLEGPRHAIVCHPMFLWPFAPGSVAYQRAVEEGAFG